MDSTSSGSGPTKSEFQSSGLSYDAPLLEGANVEGANAQNQQKIKNVSDPDNLYNQTPPRGLVPSRQSVCRRAAKLIDIPPYLKGSARGGILQYVENALKNEQKITVYDNASLGNRKLSEACKHFEKILQKLDDLPFLGESFKEKFNNINQTEPEEVANIVVEFSNELNNWHRGVSYQNVKTIGDRVLKLDNELKHILKIFVVDESGGYDSGIDSEPESDTRSALGYAKQGAEKVPGLEKQVSELKEKNRELNGKNQALQSEVGRLTNKLTDASTAKENVDKLLNDTKKTHAATIETLDGQHNKKVAELAAELEEVKSGLSVVSQVRAENDRLKSEVEKMLKRIKNLNNENNDLQHEVRQVKLNEWSRGQISHQEIQSLKKIQDGMKKEQVELLEKLNGQSRMVERFENQCKELKKQKDKAEYEKERAKQKILELPLTIDAAAYKHLREALTELTGKYQRLLGIVERENSTSVISSTSGERSDEAVVKSRDYLNKEIKELGVLLKKNMQLFGNIVEQKLEK